MYIEQSRRDDLESLGYVLLYLINGTLPWMKYFEEDDANVKSCGDMKKKITTKTLCADLPGRHKSNRIRVFQYRMKTGYFFFIYP